LENKGKTRERLSQELTRLRQRVVELEASEIEHKQEEQRLRKERDFNNALIQASPVFFVAISAEGKTLMVNDVMLHTLGYTAGEVVGRDYLTTFVPERDRGSLSQVFERLAKSHEPTLNENRILTKEGQELLVEWHGRPIFRENGEFDFFFGVGTNITERKRTEEDLREARRKMERLHEVAGQLEACRGEDEVYRLTIEAAEQTLSFSVCTLHIVEEDKLVVKATSSAVPPEARGETTLEKGGLATKTYRTKETIVFGSIDEVPEATPVRTDIRSGISAPIGDIGVFQVISTEPDAFTENDARMVDLLLGHTYEAIGRIRLQEDLKDQATHDPLTGAYNRRYFNERIEEELERCRRYKHPVAFLMMDVDRFKEINDRFGHEMGDRVLQEVAKLLQQQVRTNDLVIRYGGDEFLVVFLETDGGTEVIRERITEAMAKYNETSPLLKFPVRLSIGDAYWGPDEERAIEEVLAEADRRMYEEKEQRHGS